LESYAVKAGNCVFQPPRSPLLRTDVRPNPLLPEKTISGMIPLAGRVGIYFSNVGPMFR